MDGRWNSSIQVSSKIEPRVGNAKLCTARSVLDVRDSSSLEMNIAVTAAKQTPIICAPRSRDRVCFTLQFHVKTMHPCL